MTPLRAAGPPFRVLVLAAVLALSSLAAWFIAILDLQPGEATWLFVASVVAAPVVVRLAQRHIAPLDLFEPIVLASMVYGVLFIIPYGIAVFFGYTYPLLPSVDLTRGAQAVVAGVLSFAVGYFFVLPKPLVWQPQRRKVRPTRWADRRFLWVTVLGYCALSIGTYVFFWFPRAGGASEYLELGTGFAGNVSDFQGAGVQRAAILIASVGFFLASTHVLLRERVRLSDWTLLVLAALASLAATALARNRVFLLWNVALPVVILHYGRRPIRTAEAAFGVAVMFALAVVFTVVIRSPTAFVSRTAEGPIAGAADFLVVQAGEMFVVADIVERQVRTTGYLNGSTLVATAVNVVPRGIWPEKPLSAGEVYTRDFFPDVWLAGVTFLGVPWIGELYLNGGFPAVLGGTFVSGALAALLHRRLVSSGSALAASFQGLFAFSLFMLITRGSLQVFSYSLVWGVPLLLGLLAVTRPRRRGSIPLRSRVPTTRTA